MRIDVDARDYKVKMFRNAFEVRFHATNLNILKLIKILNLVSITTNTHGVIKTWEYINSLKVQ